MSIVSDVLERLRTLVFRAREERDLDEEIRFHLEMDAEQHRRTGVSGEEARRRGLVAFGGVDRIKEEVRDARGTRLLEESVADLRWSIRTLGRSPRFAAAVVLTLALGLGATTAVFSAVDAVMLRPLPYQRPGQLVRLYQYGAGHPEDRGFVTGLHFRAYQRQVASLESTAAIYTYSESGADIGGTDHVERIRILPVTSSYFDVLRVRPTLGRTFEARDETGAPLVILSHRLWARQFDRDPTVVGKPLTMSGIPYTVLGVMPDGFADPVAGEIDAWVPIDLRSRQLGPNNHFLTVLARLAPGTPLARAQAELDALGLSLAKEYPDAHDIRAVLVPLQADIAGPVSRALELMLGAVGLVLLLVCVNVANLMLVRASDRAREFAVRSALGAPRARLVRQLLVESLTLALAGAVAGVVVAAGVMKLLVALAAGSIPRLAGLSLDPRVLAFALALAMASALVFGLAPARKAATSQPGDVFREQSQSTSGSGAQGRLRACLVVSQVALAFVLMVGAGLLLASLGRLRETALGVTSDNVLTFQLNLPSARYDSAARGRFYEQVATALESIPGVRAAGAVSKLPATGSYHTWGTEAVTGPLAGAASRHSMLAQQRVVSGDYFRAVAIPVLAGRVFDRRDDAHAPRRVVVSRSLAERLFPGVDPLGQELHTADVNATVIGVVPDVATDPEGHTEPFVYHAHAQFAGDRNWALTQVVATAAPPEQLEPAIRRAISTLDPQLVMYQPTTLDDAIGRGRAQRVFTLRLLMGFAAVALALAALGLFGVLSYTVKLRSREIGIRMALGAEATAIRAMVLRQGLTLTALGIGLGILGALASSRLLDSLVFRVSLLVPRVLLAASLVMAAVAALAAYLPSRRATALDPRTVLQGE